MKSLSRCVSGAPRWPRWTTSLKTSYCLTRGLKTETQLPPVSFAFDIDGVILRGENVIPAAHRALDIVYGDNPWNKKIPFIFITNGGGMSEEQRARVLSRQLSREIVPNQILQSHTVMHSLVANVDQDAGGLGNEHVLILGGSGSELRSVAKGYGFRNVYTTLDILAWNPRIWPFHSLTAQELDSTIQHDFSVTPITSIFVMHDPRNWALDIQILTDILRSYPHPLGSSHPPREVDHKQCKNRPKLYFCNPDLLWKAGYATPRFGQGAFKSAFQAAFKAVTGSEHPYQQFGKPSKMTFDYGGSMLRSQYEGLMPKVGDKSAQMPKVFMIGDNPDSDIAGANAAGWYSILVETGVYDPSNGNPPAYRPTAIVRDVEDAVRWAIMGPTY